MSSLETTSIRLSPEAKQFIAQAAVDLKMTKSEVVIAALRAYETFLRESGVLR